MNYGLKIVSAKKISTDGLGERLFGKEDDPNRIVPYQCVLEDGNTCIMFWSPHSDVMSRIVLLPCHWPLSEITNHMNELSDQGKLPLNNHMKLIKTWEDVDYE